MECSESFPSILAQDYENLVMRSWDGQRESRDGISRWATSSEFFNQQLIEIEFSNMGINFQTRNRFKAIKFNIRYNLKISCFPFTPTTSTNSAHFPPKASEMKPNRTLTANTFREWKSKKNTKTQLKLRSETLKSFLNVAMNEKKKYFLNFLQLSFHIKEKNLPKPKSREKKK